MSSLEKEIQQREFRNDYHKALVNIMHTSNYIIDQMNDLFKNYDVTRQQYNVLRILRGQHPGHASILVIRERMVDKMSDASRIVERLRLKGLVVREFATNDKRSVEVTITPAGLELLSQMDGPVNGMEVLLEHIDGNEIRQLNHLLDKIRPENTSPQKKN